MKVITFLYLLILLSSCNHNFAPDPPIEAHEREALKTEDYVTRPMRTYENSDKSKQSVAYRIIKNNFKEKYAGLKKDEYIFIEISSNTVLYPSGSIKEIYNIDSLGYLQRYRYFEENGTLSYEATYKYINHNEDTYWIESQTSYHTSNGTINHTGQRINKKKKGALPNFPKNKNIGIWKYYDDSGNLIETKKYFYPKFLKGVSSKK